jgi:hypothetical protein
MLKERLKVSDHFYLDEFIPPSLSEEEGLKLIDSRLFLIVETLRVKMGVPLLINTWYNGGNRQWSGIRTPESPYYSKYSQHTCGCAVDIISHHVTTPELIQHIKDNYDEIYKGLGLRRIELGVNWLHIDLKDTNNDQLYFFIP